MAHIDTVKSIIAAWRKRQIEGVLAHLHDDVVYHYHVGSRPLQGKAMVRRFLEKFGGGQHDIRWFIRHWAQDGDRLFIEGVDDYRDAGGRRIRTPYMGVFEFDGAKVIGWRDYVDMGLILKEKSGAPRPDWLESLVAP